MAHECATGSSRLSPCALRQEENRSGQKAKRACEGT
jgi:hypothetical protein